MKYLVDFITKPAAVITADELSIDFGNAIFRAGGTVVCLIPLSETHSIISEMAGVLK